MMRITVEGQHELNGQYEPGGNPNAAMALLAAALLTDQPVTLHNVPQTTSTRTLIRLVQEMGAEITESEPSTLRVTGSHFTQRTLTDEQIGISPGVLLLIAPMLVHRQHVRLEIAFPLNRVRTHLEALRDLGIDVLTTHGAVECRAATWDFRDIILSQASVTATGIVLMLASCLGKETIIHNAACEPHIQELCHLLEAMGAHIEGVGSNVLRVLSPPTLEGAEITVGPNHIEAASIAAIAALSGGRLQINGTRQEDLRMITRIYRRLGIELDVDANSIFVPRHSQLTVMNREEDVDSSIETAIWPGFPSDLVAIATVVATQARGTSLIHEKLFNNRLLFVDRLKAMGAQIVLCDPHRAIVVGPTPLFAIYMASPDVRAGLGMLGAALIAKGVSTIDNAEAVQHTFSNVIPKLQALGAHIEVQ
jgi:UDP-N-acetylglucosamine 1-carboxyvinyltransferase